MFFRRISDSSLLTAIAFASLLVISGCGESGFESHFVTSELTESLIKEAKSGMKDHDGVVDIVDQRFGDPQDLKVWLKMPLNGGGVTGTISETPDASGPVKSLQLKLDGEFADLVDGNETLQIVSGDAASEVVGFEAWNNETGLCELKAPMQTAPKAGDQIVIGGGTVLQDGRVLYMRHCSHCHGTSGDGAGPTAEYLYPRPRDYRNGLFKFTSTKSLMRPSRDDIHRILKNGIPGTYMPSFVPMLDPDQLSSVIEYVRFLSIRGEFERKIANEFAAEYSKAEYKKRLEDESRAEILEALTEFYEEELADYVEQDGNSLADAWKDAEDEANVVIPGVARVEDSIESRRRGRELFVGAKLNCVNCHGIGAKGNGPQTREYEIVDKKPRPKPGLHDDWGHVVKPRDLTRGIYRGGRRPLDIYRRLYSGINGAKMPAFGGKVPDEQLWDVVNYVLSIPFEVEPGHSPAAAEPAKPAE